MRACITWLRDLEDPDCPTRERKKIHIYFTRADAIYGHIIEERDRILYSQILEELGKACPWPRQGDERGI